MNVQCNNIGLHGFGPSSIPKCHGCGALKRTGIHFYGCKITGTCKHYGSNSDASHFFDCPNYPKNL